MRELVPGTNLDRLARSNRRSSTFRVLLHNPRCTTASQLATDSYMVPPTDVTRFVEKVEFDENIGHENADAPGTTKISLTLKRDPATGAVALRRGLIEDGVLVQVFVGDATVAIEDWVCVFTGAFRGFPADDPGTPADKSEGLTAIAHGREEGFLNLTVPATPSFPAGTDIGEIAGFVATDPTFGMGLLMDEVLFGDQGFKTKHVTTQIVDMNCLTALWQLAFVVGKKPKFDSKGRLRFVDVRLDKPAVRIYRDRALFRKIMAAPNELDVKNSVVITGLDSVMTKSKQMPQRLLSFEAVTGFFDYIFDELKWFSEDHSQRADNTYLVTVHPIIWSAAVWTQVDEFHGRVDIDCRTLQAARIIIFVTFLALQIAVAALDLAMQIGGQAVANTPVVIVGEPFFTGIVTVAILRQILYVTSLLALAGLLWSMQFIGRGSYEIWGEPYEYVYQELMVRAKMVGLKPEQVKELTYRNDLIDNTDYLEALCLEHLRREMLKNQTYEIVMMDDPLIEVDDIIDIAGRRFYVNGVKRTLRRGAESTMTLTCWLIFRDVVGEALATPGETTVRPESERGYGFGYAERYGEEL